MFFCCLVALLVCSTKGLEILQNVEDLKGREFGHEYPRHGLLLLYWLSSHVAVDPAGGVLLQFDLARQDYGFQRHNSSSLLLDDSLDVSYYFLGSLSSVVVRTKLPPYVTQEYYNALDSPGRDLDRIVLRVQSGSTKKADKVYITSSDEQRWFEDHNRTFEIAPGLLGQVQDLQKPLDMIQVLESQPSRYPNTSEVDLRLLLPRDQLLNHLKHSEKDLRNVFEDQGLRWLLILSGYDVRGRMEVHQKTWSCTNDCDGQVQLEVKSTQDGYARVVWSDIPKNILEREPTVVLFMSDSVSGLQTFQSVKGKAAGSMDTYTALSHGLQPRLVLYKFATEYGFFGLQYSVIWRGPQFDQSNRVPPTDIAGYDASLQLFTRRGYACARLYFKKSFKDWKHTFENSWVGFYTTHKHFNDQHKYYQWVTNFMEVDPDEEMNEYLVYEYESSLSIKPGFQARFFFSRVAEYSFISSWTASVKALTLPWEG